MVEIAGGRRPGGPKKAVVSIGVPIRLQYADEDGNPVALTPIICAKYDEAVHVWGVGRQRVRGGRGHVFSRNAHQSTRYCE
jgi:hypothetical protein